MALDPEGTEGEVHRFLREDDRPDLALVNDALEVLVIIEAKDALRALLTDAQVTKSCAVVSTLAATLRTLGDNPFWGPRADYVVALGLLWGAESEATADERSHAFAIYATELDAIDFDHPGLLGIEAHRSENTIGSAAWLHDAPDGGITARTVESFGF